MTSAPALRPSKPLPAKGYCVAVFHVEASAFLPGCRYLRGPGHAAWRHNVNAFATADGDVRFTRWL